MQSEDHGPSESKRSRISQACNPCRKRKSKCGGEQPVCLVCELLGKVCTYETNPRKRGLERGYVRSLEVVLGITLRHITNSEARIRKVLCDEYGQSDLLEPEFADALSGIWRASEISQHLEELLGPGAQGRLTTLDQLQMEPNIESPRYLNAVDNLEHGVADHPPDLERTHQSPAPVTELWYLDLPGDTTELVEFYFDYTHCWFPIVKRSDILKCVHNTGTDREGAESAKFGTTLCLWAIITYARAHRRFHQPEYPPARIELLLRSEIIKKDRAVDLGFVQALLILALLYIARDELQAAWIAVAHASRLYQCNQHYFDAQSDRHEQVAQGCFILDRLLSLYFDQPPCWSSANNIIAHNSGERDSLDEWQPWTTSAYNKTTIRPRGGHPLRSLSLFALMSNVLKEDTNWIGTRSEPTTIGELQVKYQEWQHLLPAYARLHEAAPPNPAVLHLHLGFSFRMCNAHPERTSTATIDCQAEAIAEASQLTKKLVKEYLDSVGLDGSSPLLLLCAKRARQALPEISKNRSINEALSNDLDTLIVRLHSVWIPDGVTAPDASTAAYNVRTNPQRHEGSLSAHHPRVAATPTRGYTTRSADGVRTNAPMSNEPQNSTSLGNSPEHVYGNFITPNELSDDIQPPMLNLTRSNDVSTFSQNLGFLGDDLDSDWLDLFSDTGLLKQPWQTDNLP